LSLSALLNNFLVTGFETFDAGVEVLLTIGSATQLKSYMQVDNVSSNTF
jgi:hypothetical protein